MATLNSNLLTLLDWGKRLDPDGSIPDIVEMLSQENAILDDMMFKEGNLPTGERVTQRTGLPTVYYRQMNAGTPSSKSLTAQITEEAAMLVGRSEIDVKEANLNGNTAEYRMSEVSPFVEAMGQRQATTTIYGSASNPEEYVGLANRYSDLSAASGKNILDAGGTGSDNTSIWLVGHGARGTYGIFPKGSQAGLSHEDLGIQDAFDGSNNRFRAYMDEYNWDNGLVVKDWRFTARIANIDISDLEAITGTQALTAATSITKMMSRSIDRLPNLTSVKPVFYANRSVVSLLRVIAEERSSSAVTIEEGLNQFGDSIMTMKFNKIPVRLVDVIVNSEERVV